MATSASSPLILVVDDHEDTLELLEVELRMLGFDVVATSDARVAVDAAAQKRPAAVVMDIVMPEMDGCEATRRIRAALGRVPVIALTATPGLLDPAERKLFAAVLGKPCTPATVASALREALANPGP